MKIKEIEDGVPTCVAIILMICANVLLAQQPPEKHTTPGKLSAVAVLRRMYTLAGVPDAPVKLDSLAINRDKDLKVLHLEPHLRNVGTKGVIKFQLGYRISALGPTTVPDPPNGVVRTDALPGMDVIGPVEEFGQPFLPFEERSIYCRPLDDSVFVSKYGDIPRTVTIFIASVTFMDGGSWTADAKWLRA